MLANLFENAVRWIKSDPILKDRELRKEFMVLTGENDREVLDEWIKRVRDIAEGGEMLGKKKLEDGTFQIMWGGTAVGEPRSEEEAVAYINRLRSRYPGGAMDIVMGVNPGNRRKIGYRWVRSDGETGVLLVGSLAAAKSTLRYNWNVKRLPNDLTWRVHNG